MRTILTLILACLLCTVSFAQNRKSSRKSAVYTRSAGITISLPWANLYSYHDYEQAATASKGGFIGLGLSAFYRHKNNKISVNTGSTYDLRAPMGPIDFGKTGIYTSVSSFIVEANFHHTLHKNIGLVAGVNYVRYKFHLVDYDNSTGYDRYDPTLGLTTGLEIIPKKHFALAVFYRPALVGYGTQQYWHVVTLDLRFDIPVWKK